eukprot:scaffold71413_cov45-Phaeocystis_antarctica.AAC.2
MRQERLDAAGVLRGGQQRLLYWANARTAECRVPLPAALVLKQGRGSVVPGGASPLKIARFDDPRLKSGLFLLRLLSALQPDIVELTDEQAMPSDDKAEEQAEANAREVIQSTHALLEPTFGGGGGFPFAEWDDLTECRPRLVLCLLAALKTEDDRRAAMGTRSKPMDPQWAPPKVGAAKVGAASQPRAAPMEVVEEASTRKSEGKPTRKVEGGATRKKSLPAQAAEGMFDMANLFT